MVFIYSIYSYTMVPNCCFMVSFFLKTNLFLFQKASNIHHFFLGGCVNGYWWEIKLWFLTLSGLNIHLTGANLNTEVENWSPWSPSKTGLKIILCSVAAVQLFVCLLCLQICYSWKLHISWIFFYKNIFEL